jgi:hypothetical protein
VDEGRSSTGRPMSADGAALGLEGTSAVWVAFEAGASPGRGHWNPDMPLSPTGSAGLVGVAAADVGTTGEPVLFCVLEGSRISEVGTLSDGVGSATGVLVPVGVSFEVDSVGTRYEPSEYERIGALVGISDGMIA